MLSSPTLSNSFLRWLFRHPKGKIVYLISLQIIWLEKESRQSFYENKIYQCIANDVCFAVEQEKTWQAGKYIMISGIRNCLEFIGLTLLNWSLYMSRVVCGRPGNRCFKQCKRPSARSASNSLLSESTISSFIKSHDDLELDLVCLLFIGFVLVLFRHINIEASTLFAISIAWCSEDKSSQSSSWSGKNWSDIMLRYMVSPRLVRAFWDQVKSYTLTNHLAHGLYWMSNLFLEYFVIRTFGRALK